MKSIIKKSFSVLLAVIMIFSVSSVALAAENGSLMQSYGYGSVEDFHAQQYKDKIGKVVFLDLAVTPFPEGEVYAGEYDLSASEATGKVTGKIAFPENISFDDYYTLYIGAYGGVKAPQDSSYLFAGTGATEFEGIENLDTSEVTNMKEMFADCRFKSFDLDKLDTKNVTNMSQMFRNCEELEKINGVRFSTSKVTSFWNMFSECLSLKDVTLKNVDLASTSSIDYMFYGCTSLEELDLSSWKNTASITSINAFRSCPSLKTIDMSGWDISNVNCFDDVFSYCSSLSDIYLLGATDAVNSVSASDNPVKGATSLTVHTTDINFTASALWKNCFGKSEGIKVAYHKAEGDNAVGVVFAENSFVEYYIVTVYGEDKNIYPGSSITLPAGTEIKVDIKAIEDTNARHFNVNGVVMEFGSQFTVTENTVVTIQHYYDDTPVEPDETVETIKKITLGFKGLIEKIINVLEGFFGRFFPWLDN